jgi:hypothetical protein
VGVQFTGLYAGPLNSGAIFLAPYFPQRLLKRQGGAVSARNHQFIAQLISVWIVVGLPIVLAALLLSHLIPSMDRHLILAVAFVADLLAGPVVMMGQWPRPLSRVAEKQ